MNDFPARRNIRSSSQVQLLVPRYRKEPFRNDPGEEVSPFPHHSCETYFVPTSDLSTTSINFSGSDSKLTVCNSPCYATEDRCQQCDLYTILLYYYYTTSISWNYSSDWTILKEQLRHPKKLVKRSGVTTVVAATAVLQGPAGLGGPGPTRINYEHSHSASMN